MASERVDLGRVYEEVKGFSWCKEAKFKEALGADFVTELRLAVKALNMARKDWRNWKALAKRHQHTIFRRELLESLTPVLIKFSSLTTSERKLHNDLFDKCRFFQSSGSDPEYS